MYVIVSVLIVRFGFLAMPWKMNFDILAMPAIDVLVTALMGLKVINRSVYLESHVGFWVLLG